MIKLRWPWQKKRRTPNSRFILLGELIESPIEQIFWQNGYRQLSAIGKFTPQVKIGRYRADFTLSDIPANPRLRIVIELDGIEFHSTPQQRNNDAQRDRALLRQGWLVIRFTGSQVYGDCQSCIRDVIELVKLWSLKG